MQRNNKRAWLIGLRYAFAAEFGEERQRARMPPKPPSALTASMTLSVSMVG